MEAAHEAAVRPAKLEDAENIAVVQARSWQAAYRGLMPQEYLDRLDPADRVERWRQRLQDTDWPRCGVLVVTAGSELLGFAGLGPTRDEGEDQALVGEIAAIYLLPEAWGQGLGRKLMTAALDRLAAAGYAHATLWVLQSNARARRFYRLGGWAEDGALQVIDPNGVIVPRS